MLSPSAPAVTRADGGGAAASREAAGASGGAGRGRARSSSARHRPPFPAPRPPPSVPHRAIYVPRRPSRSFTVPSPSLSSSANPSVPHRAVCTSANPTVPHSALSVPPQRPASVPQRPVLAPLCPLKASFYPGPSALITPQPLGPSPPRSAPTLSLSPLHPSSVLRSLHAASAPPPALIPHHLPQPATAPQPSPPRLGSSAPNRPPFTQSQDCWSRKGLWRSSSPTPLPRHGHIEQVTQERVQKF